MKLAEVMVWWSDAEEAPFLAGSSLPAVKVLQVMSEENIRFDYLSNSVGACFAGWREAHPRDQATYLLSIFNRMVCRDRINPLEAHNEYMQIDEYREWVELETGPFSDIHWKWAEPEKDDDEIC